MAALEPKLPGDPRPERAGPWRASSDGSAASVSVVMSGRRTTPANWPIVREVRATVVPGLLTGLPGSHAYVTGDAAVALDNTQIYTDGMARIFLFVLALSFLLLMVVFHSIVIPIKAIVLNLLSTAAAYGVVVLVFQDGWLGSVLGVRPTDAIQNWIPIFIFTILFGLSMDYEVFILSRIKEFVDHGLSTREAVARGLTVTAGTVTSAAAIMVVVFAVFMTLRLVIIRELGLGLAVAVFVDATRDPVHPPAGLDAPARRVELVPAAVPALAAACPGGGRTGHAGPAGCRLTGAAGRRLARYPEVLARDPASRQSGAQAREIVHGQV